MNGTLLLTARYLAHNRGKTVVLVLALTLVFALPVAVNRLVRWTDRDLRARAEATPLLLGAKGSRVDLVLSCLYFTALATESIVMADVQALEAGGGSRTLPLHLAFTARGRPLVGTTLDYLEYRDLRPAAGTLPLTLGDCVVGARAARALGVGPGDELLTDQSNPFDIAAVYPLVLRVAGVLAPRGTPDDDAVFVDIKTAWIVEGIGHGHEDLTLVQDAERILERREGQVVGSAAVVAYTRITPDKLAAFHFHGDPAQFPLTAAIVLPRSDKDRALVRARLSASPTLQLLSPAEVVRELMQFVFRLERFFAAYGLLVTVAMILLLGLVILLSLRLRRRERLTMFKLGCARATMLRLQAAELACIVLLAAVCTAGLTSALLARAPQLLRWIGGS